MIIEKEQKIEPSIHEGIITPDTLAVVPTHHEWYQAKILDRFKADVYRAERTSRVIELACLYWMSSPEGMRKAMSQTLGCHKKLPVAIQAELKIVACPTLSPEQFECMWIFPWHVIHKGGDSKSSFVIFRNGTRLDLKVSYHVLERQIQRTCEFMVRYISSVHER